MLISAINNYVKGIGIEIGALQGPTPVPEGVKVQYVDRLPLKELQKHYPGLVIQAPDIIDDGEELVKFQDSSLNFVIASHFLEHCKDPIKAIKNMFRVLRPNGTLYLGIPDMRYTFDAPRPVTPLDHLIADHESGPNVFGHYLEWSRYVSKLPPAEAAKNAEELQEMGYSIHYHAWTQVEILDLMVYLQKQLHFDIELFQKNGIEVAVVLRKRAIALPQGHFPIAEV